MGKANKNKPKKEQNKSQQKEDEDDIVLENSKIENSQVENEENEEQNLNSSKIQELAIQYVKEQGKYIPIKMLGLSFHNKMIILQFLAVFLSMIIVPVSTFYIVSYILDLYGYTKGQQDIYGGISSVLMVQVVLIVYGIIVVFDKNNFNYETVQRKLIPKEVLERQARAELQKAFSQVSKEDLYLLQIKQKDQEIRELFMKTKALEQKINYKQGEQIKFVEQKVKESQQNKEKINQKSSNTILPSKPIVNKKEQENIKNKGKNLKKKKID